MIDSREENGTAGITDAKEQIPAIQRVIGGRLYDARNQRQSRFGWRIQLKIKGKPTKKLLTFSHRQNPEVNTRELRRTPGSL